jgi:pimeloyl-ACP methyl ester carboxylesterase
MAHFQNARLAEFDRAGHWVHHDRLDDFLTEVRAFL